MISANLLSQSSGWRIGKFACTYRIRVLLRVSIISDLKMEAAVHFQLLTHSHITERRYIASERVQLFSLSTVCHKVQFYGNYYVKGIRQEEKLVI